MGAKAASVGAQLVSQRKENTQPEGESSTPDTGTVQRQEDTISSHSTQSNHRPDSSSGLPTQLKSGIERMSGLSMGDVKVHYNSDKPAQLQAHAYAQGTDIHLASGQEKHLAHEAWHVVQQKQGRVQPTVQRKIGRRTDGHNQDLIQFHKYNKKRKRDRQKLRDQKLNGDNYTLSHQYNDKEKKEETLIEFVSKKEVAESFYRNLNSQGLTVYLSGGGALGYQGGHRPIADLDFRVSSSSAKFTSFHEPRGIAVLKYINQVLLTNERSSHRIQNAVVDEFRTIGKDGLTIGTDNWFGIEVSLSVVPSEQKTEMLEGSDDVPAIPALPLNEIMSDKLKTMISRTKKGKASVKKVSQDLFDFLDTIFLISKNYNFSIKEYLDYAIFSRMGQYVVANLEGIQLHHLHEEDLNELMSARAVLTAKAHLKNGIRNKAFKKLVSKYNTEVLGLLTKLANVNVQDYMKSELRPWMKEWDDNPFFGPPKKGKPSRLAITKGNKEQDTSSVDYLESIAPEGFLDRELLNIKNDHSKKVLKLLVLSGGFRILDDSKNNIETLEAFGLTRNQFNTAYTELRNLGYVTGEVDGLHLTEEGRAVFG
ncbi:MAG TPA: hypothetical protein DCE41_37100 [Cytophagales bacterium]|nr:hypothetical protein [Cytophagales bacterium]HAP58418.1 hypothetical protein [Cytophagales bacterium]